MADGLPAEEPAGEYPFLEIADAGADEVCRRLEAAGIIRTEDFDDGSGI